MIKHSNVKGDIKMHKLLINNERKRAWIAQVSKERKDFQPPKTFFVCSDHFVDGKSSKEHPDSTLFLKISTNTTPISKKGNSHSLDRGKCLMLKNHVVVIILVILK